MVSIKDQFLSRGEMMHFQKSFLRRWIYKGERMDSDGVSALPKPSARFFPSRVTGFFRWGPSSPTSTFFSRQTLQSASLLFCATVGLGPINRITEGRASDRDGDPARQPHRPIRHRNRGYEDHVPHPIGSHHMAGPDLVGHVGLHVSIRGRGGGDAASGGGPGSWGDEAGSCQIYFDKFVSFMYRLFEKWKELEVSCCRFVN